MEPRKIRRLVLREKIVARKFFGWLIVGIIFILACLAICGGFFARDQIISSGKPQPMKEVK